MSEQSVSTGEERRQRREGIVWRLYNEGWFTGNLDLVRDLLDPGIVWTAIEDATLAAALEAFPRQALHAWRIKFDHPVTRARIECEATPPNDFELLLRATGLFKGHAR